MGKPKPPNGAGVRGNRVTTMTCFHGEREVQRALRRALLKYKLHRDQELFEKAYGYFKQYY